jgi:CysZ protein
MFWQELKTAAKSYSRAHRVVVKHNLWGYLLIPGIASLLYAVLLAALGFIFYDDVAALGSDWVGDSIWGQVLYWAISIVFWVLVLLAIFFTHKYVTLMLLSPFLSHLSEVVEVKEFKRGKIDSSLREILSDLWRGIIINLRNLTFEFLLSIPLSFVPFVGTFLVFFVQSFYVGFSMMDYTLERKKMSVGATARFVRSHRGIAYGIGGVYNLIMLIPLVGWFFAPTYATIASTLVTLEAYDKLPAHLRKQLPADS